MLRAIVVTAAVLIVASAAWAGDVEDCNNAETLLKSDPARAVSACRRLAEQGDAAAQTKLGNMYGDGQGVPQDNTEAVRWYRKAAEQGYAPSQSNLGMLYK